MYKPLLYVRLNLISINDICLHFCLTGQKREERRRDWDDGDDGSKEKEKKVQEVGG